MTHKRKRDGLKFIINDVLVTPKSSVKYLGVTFDTKGNFRKHLEQATGKAENRIGRISRLLPNIGGPNSSKRALIAGVAHSIILYGAPIWQGALKIKRNRALLEKTQRKALIRVAAAYKTVSAMALQVVTGVPPIDLLAEERTRTYAKGKRGEPKEAKRRTLQAWQERWENNALKGQWTKELIPNLTKWLECSHRCTDYYLTQVLTGHGAFGVYAYRIGKDTSDKCAYCGGTDTVAHTIFVCNRWREKRGVVKQRLGKEIRSDNLVDTMMESKQSWEEVHQMIRDIMRNKEKEMRTR